MPAGRDAGDSHLAGVRDPSLSADLGMSEMAVAPRIADMVGSPGRAVNRRSANVGCWDVATVDEIDAMQRNRSSAPPQPHDHRWL